MKHDIIIDTDPGIDDAFAIMIALQNTDVFDVKLITSAVGNMPLDIVTKNALFLVETFSPYHIDVARGSKNTMDGIDDKNMSEDLEKVFGKHGLGLFVPPATKQQPLQISAVEAIKNTLLSSKEKMIVFALGPSGNIAQAILDYPEIKEKIDYIFLMGGSVDGKGNATPFAEFNVYFDPVAFDIVLKSEIKVVLSPLHLGKETASRDEDFTSRKANTFKEQFIRDMIAGSFEASQVGRFALHDAHVPMGVLRPELYDFFPCDISVSLDKEHYGQTFVTKNPQGKHIVQLAKDNETVRKTLFEEIYKESK